MDNWEDHMKEMGFIDEAERQRLAMQRILREQLERVTGRRSPSRWPKSYCR